MSRAQPIYRGPAPEPPVNPQTRLVEAARAFYAVAALPPTTSELIDQLVHSTSPAERLQLAARIGKDAP